MRQIRFFVTLALLSIVPSFSALAQNQAPRQAAANQRPLVIRGGLLVDGTGAAPVPNSVIVVSNGRIQAVGREGTVTVPANATIIEAGGKTVIPGLVDSHVHLRNYHIQDYLYWELRQSVTWGIRPAGWSRIAMPSSREGRRVLTSSLADSDSMRLCVRSSIIRSMRS